MPIKIFVTGTGIVSPAGLDVAAAWQALLEGRRFVTAIADRDRTGGAARTAGIIPDFTPPAGFEVADRVCQLAVAAADQAVLHADLRGRRCQPADPARTGVSFGTSKGGIATFDALVERFRYSDLKDSISSYIGVITTSKSYLPQVLKDVSSHSQPLELYSGIKGVLPPYTTILPDASAALLARRFDAQAGTHCTVAACSTGTLAIIRAVQMIADGQADLVIAGGSDASVLPLWFAAFEQMGVLAPEDPAWGPWFSCRPFDRHRRGFAIGEGAAALILESEDSMRRRHATPLARISAYAMGTDPAGLAMLSRHGAPLAQTIKIACARAGLKPDRISAVQAHGTGTLANDLIEIQAIRSACGGRMAEIPIVSFKGALGHLLGAAGAVELAFVVEAIRHRMLPPNATLLEADPQIRPANLPVDAEELATGPILKTSMGFGGHLAAILIDQP